MAKTLLATKPASEKNHLRRKPGYHLLPNRTLVLIIVISAVAVGGGVLTFAIGIPDPPCTGISGTTRNIVIIADVNGFNDSINHQGQTWPIINAVRCDIVKITIVNGDTQTHGLAVDYYGSQGTEIPGRQSIAFPTFQVTRAGHFGVRCVIRCTVHYLMINGILNVS